MQKISVEKAISKGQLWVNLPVMIVMFGMMIVSSLLISSKIIPLYIGIIMFISAFVFAWLTWSILITKWRIWAFSNVEDLIELHEQAVEAKLIWEQGSFFEKTEIRNTREKAIIEELEIQINKHNRLPKRFKDDVTVPTETQIFFVKTVNFIQFLFTGMLPLIGGIYFVYDGEFNWFFMIFIGLGGYNSFNELKEIFDKEPQIIINKGFIKINRNEPFRWKDGVQWTLEQHGSRSKYWLLEVYSNGKSVSKEIDDLDILPSDLKRLIKIYSGRASSKK
jgi:hypothetical protein